MAGQRPDTDSRVVLACAPRGSARPRQRQQLNALLITVSKKRPVGAVECRRWQRGRHAWTERERDTEVHTVHGGGLGLLDGLVLVRELCPGPPVLHHLLVQALLQGLQLVVQVDLQAVLFLKICAVKTRVSRSVIKSDHLLTTPQLSCSDK